MRVIIEDEYLVNLYVNGKPIGKPRFNAEVELIFVRRIVQIEQARNTNDLRNIKSLHFEKLTGKLVGKYSIRVNRSFRIIFRIEKDGDDNRIEIICVEELNNHYS